VFGMEKDRSESIVQQWHWGWGTLEEQIMAATAPVTRRPNALA